MTCTIMNMLSMGKVMSIYFRLTSFFIFLSSSCSARPCCCSWCGEHADPGSGEGKSKCS
jgi:hypothetical protein